MVQWGTSLDMETIRDVPFAGSGQENGPYYFVEKPGLPLDVDPATPQHPHFQVDAPLTADINAVDTEGLGSNKNNIKRLRARFKKLKSILERLLGSKTVRRRSSRDERMIKIAQILMGRD